MAEEGYRTALGAFPYAARTSESLLFKAYSVLGTLVALLGTVVVLFAIVTLLGALSGTPAGVLTFQPALYLLVWLFVVGPMIAPVLLVARQHRRGYGRRRYDTAMAVAGFCQVLAVYLAAIISTPPEQQETVGGLLAPVVTFLYGLPQLAGLVPPLLVGLAIVAIHYRWRRTDTTR